MMFKISSSTNVRNLYDEEVLNLSLQKNNIIHLRSNIKLIIIHFFSLHNSYKKRYARRIIESAYLHSLLLKDIVWRVKKKLKIVLKKHIEIL